MPIYEYQCRDCGHKLTAKQRISEPPLATCPDCQTDSLQRLISQTSFVLKGSGWYASDYKPAPAGDSGAGSEGASSEGSTTDSGASSSDAPSSPTASSDD